MSRLRHKKLCPKAIGCGAKIRHHQVKDQLGNHSVRNRSICSKLSQAVDRNFTMLPSARSLVPTGTDARVAHLIPIANPRPPFSIFSHFGGGSFFDFVLVGDVVEVGFDGWARRDEHAGGRPFEDIAFADEPIVEALASFL